MKNACLIVHFLVYGSNGVPVRSISSHDDYGVVHTVVCAEDDACNIEHCKQIKFICFHAAS